MTTIHTYDVFLSFKNLNEDGTSTRESVLAQELYELLTSRGLKVFFSNVSLENHGVAAYKQAIDDALDRARILVAVGTSAQNLNSQWVRYEWDGFVNDILSGTKPQGRVFAYLENMEPTALPRSLRQSQTLQHGPDSVGRLYNFIVNGFAEQPELAPSPAARAAPVVPPRRCARLFIVLGGAIGVAILVALLVRLLFFGEPKEIATERETPAVPLPIWTEKLSIHSVLSLIANEAPPRPAGVVQPPSLRLDLLGRRKGEDSFRALNPGDSLASDDDLYLVVVRPETVGWLYVFQIDARGTLTWLFPRNKTTDLSYGANPVVPAIPLQMPSEERGKALDLDDAVGPEHVVAVFSAVQWPALEEALARTGSRPVANERIAEPLLLTRGPKEERPLSPQDSRAIQRIIGGQPVRLNLKAREQSASGAFLAVSRWFRHVNPEKQ